MGRCLEIAPSFVSVVVRDITSQGVTPGSPEAWEGRNLVNTFPNGASKKSISIYANGSGQWSGHLIYLEPGP